MHKIYATGQKKKITCFVQWIKKYTKLRFNDIRSYEYAVGAH